MYKNIIVFLFLLTFFTTKSFSQHSGHDMPSLPLTVESNEADKEQLALARSEGNMVDNCTNWLIDNSGFPAQQVFAGEYKITPVLSSAEGYYEFNNGKLEWVNPAGVNAHLWVFVQDGADARVVPMLGIFMSITDETGKNIIHKTIPFSWMPLLHGYGDNFTMPSAGKYNIEITISPAPFRRHDPYNGDRFSKLTTALITLQADPAKLNSKGKLSGLMEKQQNLARYSGDAFNNTLHGMYKQATDGRDTLSGDYFIAYATEYSEGYWHFDEENFRYKIEAEQSAETNCHVEVAVCDRKTGRFIPGLNVTATVYDNTMKKINTMNQPFMWHPWLFHYGENWRVPSSGSSYRLHVHFDPPAYRRYGKTLGSQFTAPVDLDFDNVKLITGER